MRSTQFSFFPKDKDYVIDNEKANEFCIIIKHPSLIYNELVNFAQEKIPNFVFSIIDNHFVKLHLSITNVNHMNETHKQFNKILSFLNKSKLYQISMKDYDEILQKYDLFLMRNNLKQYIQGLQGRTSRQSALDCNSPSGNMAF